MTPVMQKRRPYQFTIRRLLLLSTAIAASLAVARSLDVRPLVQAIIGAYFSLIVLWAVMRSPAVGDDLREIRQRRKDLLEQRRALAAEVQEKRRRRSTSRKAATVNSQGRKPLVS